MTASCPVRRSGCHPSDAGWGSCPRRVRSSPTSTSQATSPSASHATAMHAWRRCCPSSACRDWAPAVCRSCRVGSGSASPLLARSLPSRRLLLDEPFSALDASLRGACAARCARRWRRPARPRCSSPTTRRRRCPSPTGSRSARRPGRAGGKPRPPLERPADLETARFVGEVVELGRARHRRQHRDVRARRGACAPGVPAAGTRGVIVLRPGAAGRRRRAGGGGRRRARGPRHRPLLLVPRPRQPAAGSSWPTATRSPCGCPAGAGRARATASGSSYPCRARAGPPSVEVRIAPRMRPCRSVAGVRPTGGARRLRSSRSMLATWLELVAMGNGRGPTAAGRRDRVRASG